MKSKPDFKPRQAGGNTSPGGNAGRPQSRGDNRPQAAPAGNDWFTQAMGQAKKK